MKFLLYLCIVFQIIRQYTPVILIMMMSMFVVALAIDEYNDSRRIAEDLRVEGCVELETEDYEWDEGLTPSLTPVIISKGEEQNYMSLLTDYQLSAPYISDKQKLGLVRRYAPRKAFVGYNYART